VSHASLRIITHEHVRLIVLLRTAVHYAAPGVDGCKWQYIVIAAFTSLVSVLIHLAMCIHIDVWL